MRQFAKKITLHAKHGTLLGVTVRHIVENWVPGWINTRSYKKIYDNVIKSKANLKTPVTINIETTNRCNAKCTFCPRDELTRKQGFMDDELFEKIVNDIVAGPLNVKAVNMNGFGEPFLDTKLVDRIDYIKKKAPYIKIFLYSNGALLVKPIADKVLGS